MTSAAEAIGNLLATREDAEAAREGEVRLKREAAERKEQQKEARLAAVCVEAGRLVDAENEDATQSVKMSRDCVLEMAPQDSIHSIGLFPGELKGFFQKQLGMPSNFNTVYGWDRTPGSDLLKAEQAAGAVQSAFVAAVESAGRNPFGAVCAQDMKECPDGSGVSRTGSNCEFAACPTAKKAPVSHVKSTNTFRPAPVQ